VRCGVGDRFDAVGLQQDTAGSVDRGETGIRREHRVWVDGTSRGLPAARCVHQCSRRRACFSQSERSFQDGSLESETCASVVPPWRRSKISKHRPRNLVVLANRMFSSRLKSLHLEHSSDRGTELAAPATSAQSTPVRADASTDRVV